MRSRRTISLGLASGAGLALLFAMASPCLAQKAGVKLPEDKRKLHIYLLLGQSNMSGRGYVYKEDRVVNERILALGREDQWVFGVEPLHWDKPPGIAGVGPGRAFAESLLEEMPSDAEGGEKSMIGLVPCAETGSSLAEWQKGGKYYARAVLRGKRAAKDGVLKGILWHQGETDAAKFTSAVNYGERLRQVVTDLRKDLGDVDLPFVCAKLSERIPANRFPAVAMVNQGLEDLRKHVSLTDCASVKGLTLIADGVHFDVDSQRLLGQRYAGLMWELHKKARR